MGVGGEGWACRSGSEKYAMHTNEFDRLEDYIWACWLLYLKCGRRRLAKYYVDPFAHYFGLARRAAFFAILFRAGKRDAHYITRIYRIY